MDDLDRQYSKLETELSKLSSDFDQQQRMLSRALKMLLGAFESDYPEAVQGISWSKLETLSQAQSIVRDLEACYRSFTMDREKIATNLYRTVNDWIAHKLPNASPHDLALLEKLSKDMESTCQGYTGLAKLLPELLKLDQTSQDSDLVEAQAGNSTVLPVEVLISIKRMLALIPLEEVDRKRTAKIAEGFGDAMLARDLVTSLQSVVSILEQRQATQVDDVADFLKLLAEQLVLLQEELRESREADDQHEQKDDAHSETMSQGFDDIKAGLNTAKTLDELKSVVASQLDTLVVSFADFKHRREERAQIMQSRYDDLVSRLSAVETDANSAHCAIDRERKKALTDHLTGIPNRRAYEERVRAELYRWERYNTPFTVLVVDIDFFKKINDTLGHLIGDRALKLVAKVLGRLLRESDFIARYGGEEFVVLLAASEMDAALKTAEKLRYAIEKAPFKYNGELVDIRVSIGVTQVTTKDTSVRIFERADKALYRAKQAGRNRVEPG